MGKPKPKVICWDMDETLGEFRRIALDMFPELYNNPNQLNNADKYPPVSLTKNIEKVLDELTNKNYVHFVTTSANNEYAKEVLKRTKLESKFKKMYAREDNYIIPPPNIIGWWHTKDYSVVAKDMKLSKKQASSNMLVISDAIGDRPSTIENVVFICDEGLVRRDANYLMEIIEELETKGKGNFYSGFKKMFKEATLVNEMGIVHPNTGKFYGTTTKNLALNKDLNLRLELYDEIKGLWSEYTGFGTVKTMNIIRIGKNEKYEAKPKILDPQPLFNVPHIDPE